MVKPRFSFKKILTKRQCGLNHIVFYENFDEKIIQFNPYSLFGKF